MRTGCAPKEFAVGHRFARGRPGARRLPDPWRRRGRDAGQISLLVLGLFVLVAMLILGTIDVTAAQLARMRLLDTADAIALDAADALDERTAYLHGLPDHLTL